METPDCLIVLVVDDSDDARLMLAEYLAAAAGFRVKTAADGLRAIEVAQQVKPGIIIMDLAMPVLDGTSAIRRLNADPETRGIPILVLTAFRPSDAPCRQALEAGAAEVPISPQHIEQRIRHYCSQPPPTPIEV
ncbi:MAG TPA: response regulator [Thermoanaerobaculia bacterium]|nr:response regulator [Thermoanaerobaculia bacterium]